MMGAACDRGLAPIPRGEGSAALLGIPGFCGAVGAALGGLSAQRAP